MTSSAVHAVRQGVPGDDLVVTGPGATWSAPAVGGLVAAALVAAVVAAGAATWGAGTADLLGPAAVQSGAVTGGAADPVPHPRPGTLPRPDR